MKTPEEVRERKPKLTKQDEHEPTAEGMSFEDYCKLIGAGPFNEPAFTIYRTLKANGYIITKPE